MMPGFAALSYAIIDAKPEEFDDISIKIEEDESNLDNIHIANESLGFQIGHHNNITPSTLPPKCIISPTSSPCNTSEYSDKCSPQNIRYCSVPT